MRCVPFALVITAVASKAAALKRPRGKRAGKQTREREARLQAEAAAGASQQQQMHDAQAADLAALQQQAAAWAARNAARADNAADAAPA